ncbi:MAG: ABC transporter permease subunit [Betaproteobacteria bacterium]|nr:MAG: ABC transporter permease subunit [Betaproteobacteria bacterium]
MLSMSDTELGIIVLSLKVAFFSVALSLPVAILVAHVLARFDFPGKTLLDAVIHLPLVLPPVVVGFALLLLFGKHGPIGAWLNDWFGIVIAFRWTGAALASAIMGFPLMVRAIRLSISSIDTRLETVARTLGGSRTWVFLSITLPLAIYTFVQSPGGDAQATRLSLIAVVLSIAALITSEWLTRRTSKS